MNIADFKFIIKIFNDKFDFNLWDKYEGITEEDLIENGKGKRAGNAIALLSCIGMAPLQNTDFKVISSIRQTAARHLNIDLVFPFTD